jgi:hypothetical protein
MTDATAAVRPLRRRMIDDMSLRNLSPATLWRDNLGERLASIRMRIDCRGVVMMPALIVAGNGQSLV